MRRFWNARAREDAVYFVDTRMPYRGSSGRRFDDAEQLLDYFLSCLGVAIGPQDTVLEIGCGVGRITRALAGRAREVIALDVSDQMLARARLRNPDLERVRWVLGDGLSLAPVGERRIDACVSIVTFQHFPSPAVAHGYVCELGRVLRAGGWAALQVSNDPDVHRPRGGLRSSLRAIAGRAPRGQRHPAWLGSHVELPALAATARRAGLELERVWGERTQYCGVLLRR